MLKGILDYGLNVNRRSIVVMEGEHEHGTRMRASSYAGDENSDGMFLRKSSTRRQEMI